MSKSKIDPSNLEAKVERKSETTWLVELEEDPETGDLIMPIPDDLLATQGWTIGDTLIWGQDEKTGNWTLTKSTK